MLGSDLVEPPRGAILRGVEQYQARKGCLAVIEDFFGGFVGSRYHSAGDNQSPGKTVASIERPPERGAL